MKTDTIARKYLNLIILLSLGIFIYNVWGLLQPNKNKKTVTSSGEQKELIKKIDETNARMNSHVYYLNTTLAELKALEASSSINIVDDIKLNKLYLENFLSK